MTTRTNPQNTKEIKHNSKNIVIDKKDISDNKVDIVQLFERLIQIETKLDMMSYENRDNNKLVKTIVAVVLFIEVVNLVINLMMILN